MTNCLRCGQCCYFQDKEGPTDKKCKFLIILKSGKTLCRIYKTRLGTKLGPKNQCIERKDCNYNFKGCPYNKDGQKEFNVEVK